MRRLLRSSTSLSVSHSVEHMVPYLLNSEHLEARESRLEAMHQISSHRVARQGCFLSSIAMTQSMRDQRDDEERRLFVVYEASSAKEHNAATKLLSPRHDLSRADYRKLLGDLRAIRSECNEDMLAIAAHHKNRG